MKHHNDIGDGRARHSVRAVFASQTVHPIRGGQRIARPTNLF